MIDRELTALTGALDIDTDDDLLVALADRCGELALPDDETAWRLVHQSGRRPKDLRGMPSLASHVPHDRPWAWRAGCACVQEMSWDWGCDCPGDGMTGYDGEPTDHRDNPYVISGWFHILLKMQRSQRWNPPDARGAFLVYASRADALTCLHTAVRNAIAAEPEFARRAGGAGCPTRGTR